MNKHSIPLSICGIGAKTAEQLAIGTPLATLFQPSISASTTHIASQHSDSSTSSTRIHAPNALPTPTYDKPSVDNNNALMGAQTRQSYSAQSSILPPTTPLPTVALSDALLAKAQTAARATPHLWIEKPSVLPAKQASSSNTTALSMRVTPSSAHTAVEDSDEVMATAVYAYQAQQDNELSVNPGDMLTISRITSSGWWEASLAELHGWVPANFLRREKTKKISFSARIDTLNNYIVTYYQKASGSRYYHELSEAQLAAFFQSAPDGVFLFRKGQEVGELILSYKMEGKVIHATFGLSDDGKLLRTADGDLFSLPSYFARYSYYLLTPISVAELAQAASAAATKLAERSPLLAMQNTLPPRSSSRQLPTPQIKPPRSSSTAIEISLTIPAANLHSLQLLGEGAYGKVMQGKWHDLTEVAIKELKVTALGETVENAFRHEAQVMANLRSPRIVQFYGVCFEAPLRLVMEYMPHGSLFSLLQSQKDIAWPQRLQIATDTGEGLYFLHVQNPLILHRDLKSLNILLDMHYRAKLTDFGLAQVKQVINATSKQQSNASQSVGTLAWMAPELFLPAPSYSTASDVFAYGVVLWELASQEIPFRTAANPSLIPQWVEQGIREKIPKETPPQYAKLITQCWAGRKEERPPIKHLITELKTLAREYSAEQSVPAHDESDTSQASSTTDSSVSSGVLQSFNAKNNLHSEKDQSTYSRTSSSPLASFAPKNNLASVADESSPLPMLGRKKL